MVSPAEERPPHYVAPTTSRSSEEGTFVGENSLENDPNRLFVHDSRESNPLFDEAPSDSQTREEKHRLDDDLAMLQVERAISNQERQSSEAGRLARSASMHRSRSRPSDQVDEFDAATNPLHEKTAVYKPPEVPTTSVAKAFKWVHESSFLVRYFTYIVPLALILLIPLLLGALIFTDASVGGVKLMWFSIWLEIVWLTLWAGRILAKMIPFPLGLMSSLFTNNSKKWRDLGKQLEVPATLFFWMLAVEISFLPTMTYHHKDGNRGVKHWEKEMNKVIVSLFIGAILNFIEKIIIQLIAISFHLRTYADRIELNKFQIGSLTKLYSFSRNKIEAQDSEFEEGGASGPASGTRTPGDVAQDVKKVAKHAFAKVGDVAGAVAGDFAGKQVAKSDHPHQIVLTLLSTTSGSQVLARRLYRTFVRDGFDTVFSGDLKSAFDNEDEAEAAFSMFDKDMNGDISMEELEAVCVEIGRERKSITASLKDLDSVVSKLDSVLLFVVIVITLLVLLSLLSTSAAGVLTSAGSTVLALSWLFSATAQEFLQSVIFVFVKHPFDVGDRVSIYGNTGSSLRGDDYFVKEIALLYTEFKKMEGHVVQAPNSYLNTLFILNMRRSGGLAEAVPIVIKFGTTLHQIDSLRQSLLEFVRVEKREYQGNILTELRDVTEAYSLTLNVVFFYKSNWQNEGLRLQRRNKFICALMVTMQELGIEGPYRNNPGAAPNIPYHVLFPGQAPQLTSGHDAPAGPGDDPILGSSEPATQPLRQHPSILRNRAGSRARGESVSSMAKRVDFSLGMKDVSSSDVMSDVSDRRSPARVLEIARSANRDESVQRTIPEEDEEDNRTTGRSTSRETPQARGGLVQRLQNESEPRLSTSSSIHRNRFFNRFQRGAESSPHRADSASESLMEQGRMDPRTGTVTPHAMRDDSTGYYARPVRSQTEDFEMRRLGP